MIPCCEPTRSRAHSRAVRGLFLGIAIAAALRAAPHPIAAGPDLHAPAGASTIGGERSALRHAVAVVNDPMSHGVLGDGLLSLAEAIQLHNGTLTFAQLSAAEMAQIGGFSSDISEITIDTAVTPQITVQQDLDIIVDSPHGLLIEGFNGRPVIDLSNSNVHHGFRAANNLCSWRNLVLQGGTFGIDLQQTDASFGGTIVDNVVFDGQSQFALAASGTSVGGYSRVLLDQCTIRNTPRGLRCDERSADRTTVLALFRCTFQVGIAGMDIDVGSGGHGTIYLEAVRIDTPGDGIRLSRQAGANRPVQFQATHLDVTSTDCVSLEGSPTGATDLALRMLDLKAVNGGAALRLWPADIAGCGVVEDSRLRGDCDFLVGAGSTGLTVANCRFTTGHVTFGTSPSQTLQLNQLDFDGCTVATIGSAPVTAVGCSFAGGSLSGAFNAPLLCSWCFVSPPATGLVVLTTPLPSSPLGRFQVLPHDPLVGGSFTLQADLPPGLAALFVLGPTLEVPLLLDQPLHVYLDLDRALVVPGAFRAQQSLVVAVPPWPVLFGTDWVVQAAVWPDPGVIAPELQLPPGRRFVLQ